MKKILILILLLTFSISTVITAEGYGTGSFNKAVMVFLAVYKRLNNNFNVSYYKNSKYYTTFDDVWNYSVKAGQYELIPNGIAFTGAVRIEIKYTKLKNTCSPASAKPEDACAKLLVDVNGFSEGSNKLYSDASTLDAKDQFVLYLFSNGVRAAKDSIEETLLFLNNIEND